MSEEQQVSEAQPKSEVRQDTGFTPKIVGFLCNWCTYAAADLAGSTKLEISPALTVIRVMCSSRVDHNLLLTTFFSGADGILIAGCHPGDCHYNDGNFMARRKVALSVNPRLLAAIFTDGLARWRYSRISPSSSSGGSSRSLFSNISQPLRDQLEKSRSPM